MVLTFQQGHEGSEYVLRFEIGQREDGFNSTRADGQTHRNGLGIPGNIWFRRFAVKYTPSIL